MTYSAVLIIPAAMLDPANVLGTAMGWGAISYTIPLGAAEDEDRTVTHYACRADVSAQFKTWIDGTSPLPDPAAQPIVDALIADFSTTLWGRGHLDAALAANGLSQVAL